jgi:DNA gyrase subunit B
MTKIGAGGKFDKDSYNFWWTPRCGVSVVNALSNHLTATVHSGDGKVYQQEYEKEKRYTVKQIGETTKRNNSYFYPDETIFTQTTDFSYDTLSAVCVSCPTLTRE